MMLQSAQPAYISTRPTELVSSVSSGCGLQILYRYTRSIHLYSATMATIELTLVNTGSEELTEVKIANKVTLQLVCFSRVGVIQGVNVDRLLTEYPCRHIDSRIFGHCLASGRKYEAGDVRGRLWRFDAEHQFRYCGQRPPC